jgi:hypothetical protein
MLKKVKYCRKKYAGDAKYTMMLSIGVCELLRTISDAQPENCNKQPNIYTYDPFEPK